MTSFFGKLFLINFGLGLTLRTDGEVLERSRAFARRIAWPAAVAVVGYKGLVPRLVPVAAMGAVIAVSWVLHERLEGWAFVATAVTIVLVTATIFLNLYPRVMVSSLGPLVRRNSAPRSGVVPVTNRIRGKPGPPPQATHA